MAGRPSDGKGFGKVLLRARSVRAVSLTQGLPRLRPFLLDFRRFGDGGVCVRYQAGIASERAEYSPR